MQSFSKNDLNDFLNQSNMLNPFLQSEMRLWKWSLELTVTIQHVLLDKNKIMFGKINNNITD